MSRRSGNYVAVTREIIWLLTILRSYDASRGLKAELTKPRRNVEAFSLGCCAKERLLFCGDSDANREFLPKVLSVGRWSHG